MNKLTHTPGPWKVNDIEGIVYFEDKPNGEEPGICHTQTTEMYSLSPDQAAANAKLIAAAPDLLAVLLEAQELLDSVAFVSQEGDTDDILKKISKVIAKAVQS